MTSPSTSLLERAWPGDRHRLAGLVRALERARRRGRPTEGLETKLQRLLAESRELWEKRLAGVPQVELEPQLPISGAADEIAAAIRDCPVVVVCGETGSGKSTQLPKICLKIGRGIDRMIGHTQPRRLAAQSIAQRLAQELGTPLGQQVGYQIRFTDRTQPETYIKLMTDGILLAETQFDRRLERYDTLILDEAHERSLNVDFLLGYVKRLLPRRPDLRLIITSATIDAERFAEHFRDVAPGGQVPIIEVSGRVYPVEIRYRPSEDRDGVDLGQQIAQAVDELWREGLGDVLVFLPTERDIRDVAKTLRGRYAGRSSAAEVLPLYARLPSAEQQRIFRPSAQRRIVLATNVAESSLTVPGIRYVVDSGLARMSRYAPRSKLQRLPIEPISQASANQRAGRCGRVADGICIRLYSEEDLASRDAYTTPEIRRTNLAAVVLQTLVLELGPIGNFPLLDPPRPDAIRDGYKTLFELGAIDTQQRLTPLGRQLSRLPTDPRIARMILAAHDEGALHEVLIIAAALEIQDPRLRPPDRQQEADTCHQQFAAERSDFLSFLKLWDFYHQLREKLSRSKLDLACNQNFLSLRRLREWQDVFRQLRQLVEAAGMRVGKRRDDYVAIHRALLAGLVSNVAMRRGKFDYQVPGGSMFRLWPGSGLFSGRPEWVVAAELVETQRRYLRTVAQIDPAWIPQVAEHLIKRAYHDPYWSRKHETCYAIEKITLGGLPVVAGRRVPHAARDPRLARELFILQGLVGDQLRHPPKVIQLNQKLVESLRQQAARTRRPGEMVEDWAVANFYQERLPAQVYDMLTLKRWWDRASEDERERLFMKAEDLLPQAEVRDMTREFPDELDLGGVRAAVAYRFEPGADDDGLVLTVPVEAAGRLTTGRLEWLVPGRLEEKLAALIRSLPKSIRRSLIPAPDTARKAAERLPFGEGDFLQATARVLSQLSGERIEPRQFDLEKLPDHLRPLVRLVDVEGKVVAEGRDVEALRREHAEALQGVSAPSGDSADTSATSARGGLPDEMARWQRDGITEWDFGDLPREVQISRGGLGLSVYPALEDRGDSVSLVLADSPEAAQQTSRRGVRRLFTLAERKALQTQVRWFPQIDRLQVMAALLPGRPDLTSQLGDMLAAIALGRSFPVPTNREAFATFRQQRRQQLASAAQQAAAVLPSLLELHQQIRAVLEGDPPATAREAWQDITNQLDSLVRPGFLSATPWQWLAEYPRYLRAILVRLDKLNSGGGARDREQMEILRPHRKRWDDWLAAYPAALWPPGAEEYRWMLEEFRVSLFAQQLGTRVKVSPQRLERQWAEWV